MYALPSIFSWLTFKSLEVKCTYGSEQDGKGTSHKFRQAQFIHRKLSLPQF